MFLKKYLEKRGLDVSNFFLCIVSKVLLIDPFHMSCMLGAQLLGKYLGDEKAHVPLRNPREPVSIEPSRLRG